MKGLSLVVHMQSYKFALFQSAVEHLGVGVKSDN